MFSLLNSILSESTISANDTAETISENAVVSGNDIIVELASIDSVEDLNDKLGLFQGYLETLPEKLMHFGFKFIIAILILFIGGKIISIIRKIIRKALNLRNTELGVIQFLDALIKYLLYFVLIVMIAGFFGFQTTSLIALLGSFGVAVALGLQGSLSNFIGGVLILLLKPFKIGDYIIEDTKGNEGIVTEIHLFYTKLKTVDDKTVILPNGALANTSITNLNMTPQRMLIIKVGISYESSIKEAKNELEQLVLSDDRIIKDMPYNIFVDSLDESCVTLCARFHVKNEDYFPVKWDFLEKAKLTFDEKGIIIPFNQLDVLIKNDNK